jgi:poly(A) polymerase
LGGNGGDDRQPITADGMARLSIDYGPDVAAIVAAIGDARFVGGCVRDGLAGQVAKDVDLATPLTPRELTARLNAAAIKVIPTGIAHGTVTAVKGDAVVEVTTLRRDVATDGRHATVAYTDDWREDAARRDFTINALYADPATGEVSDYFGGIDDLAAGIVRFIGTPLARIAEDHLRILRFFRFYARFGVGPPDAESLAAVSERANDLMTLSRERVAVELLAILALPNPSAVISIMMRAGIFAPVLPEVDTDVTLDNLVTREVESGISPDPIRRFAALFPADAVLADEIAKRLRFSNVQRRRLVAAARRTPEDGADPRALAYRMGIDAATDRLLIAGFDGAADLATWVKPVLPITGGTIVAQGVKAGPDVARILATVENRWIDESFPDAARCQAILAEVLSVEKR